MLFNLVTGLFNLVTVLFNLYSEVSVVEPESAPGPRTSGARATQQSGGSATLSQVMQSQLPSLSYSNLNAITNSFIPKSKSETYPIFYIRCHFEFLSIQFIFRITSLISLTTLSLHWKHQLLDYIYHQLQVLLYQFWILTLHLLVADLFHCSTVIRYPAD